MSTSHCVLCEGKDGYRASKIGSYVYCECSTCKEYYIEDIALSRFESTVLGIRKEFSKRSRNVDDDSILVIKAAHENVQKGVATPRVNGIVRSKSEITKNGI